MANKATLTALDLSSKRHGLSRAMVMLVVVVLTRWSCCYADNHIDGKGIKALADAIAMCPNLQELKLRGAGVAPPHHPPFVNTHTHQSRVVPHRQHGDR